VRSKATAWANRPDRPDTTQSPVRGGDASADPSSMFTHFLLRASGAGHRLNGDGDHRRRALRLRLSELVKAGSKQSRVSGATAAGRNDPGAPTAATTGARCRRCRSSAPPSPAPTVASQTFSAPVAVAAASNAALSLLHAGCESPPVKKSTPTSGRDRFAPIVRRETTRGAASAVPGSTQNLDSVAADPTAVPGARGRHPRYEPSGGGVRPQSPRARTGPGSRPCHSEPTARALRGRGAASVVATREVPSSSLESTTAGPRLARAKPPPARLVLAGAAGLVSWVWRRLLVTRKGSLTIEIRPTGNWSLGRDERHGGRCRRSSGRSRCRWMALGRSPSKWP